MRPNPAPITRSTLLQRLASKSRIGALTRPVVLPALLLASVTAQTGATGQEPAPPASSAAAPVDAALVARGAYLARLGDCAACHSVPGTPAFTGGLALHSPLGTIYSTNITPDRETGIGSYSLHDFEQVLRAGKTPQHRLYPAMPYASFTKTTSDDIRALYAFFMHGVPAVHRIPQKTDLPFPFSQRWGLALWNFAFLDSGTYRPDPGRKADWNRGAYIVQGLGHCGSCHTPRGVAYEERGYTQDSSHYLSGGVTDHWFAPNLTGEPTSGLGSWNVAELAQFLKTGHGASTMAFGPMKQVVTDSMQYADDADLHAIAVYLKSLAPSGSQASFRAPTKPSQTEQWIASGDFHVPGSGLYANFCSKCHQPDGRGKPGDAPALARSAVVRSPNPASVIHLILSGGKPIQPAGMADIKPMPSFAAQFNDREIAEVASFVRSAWGNNAAPVTTRAVTQARAAITAENK